MEVRMTRLPRVLTTCVAVTSLAVTAWAATGSTPRPGGSLNVMLREDLPQGFAIHNIYNFGRMQEVWRDR
jgi:hypothetical protein